MCGLLAALFLIKEISFAYSWNPDRVLPVCLFSPGQLLFLWKTPAPDFSEKRIYSCFCFAALYRNSGYRIPDHPLQKTNMN